MNSTTGTVRLKVNLQKIACQKTEGYITRINRATPIDDAELVRQAASDSMLSEAVMAAVFTSMQKVIKQLCLAGHRVQLGELGWLSLTVNAHLAPEDSPEEAGGGAIYRKKLHLRTSRTMRDLLKRVRLVTDAEEKNNEESETI